MPGSEAAGIPVTFHHREVAGIRIKNGRNKEPLSSAGSRVLWESSRCRARSDGAEECVDVVPMLAS